MNWMSLEEISGHCEYSRMAPMSARWEENPFCCIHQNDGGQAGKGLS